MTTTYPEYENILVEQSEEPEGLIKVTLNRPQALNALSADLLDDFFNFLDIFVYTISVVYISINIHAI